MAVATAIIVLPDDLTALFASARIPESFWQTYADGLIAEGYSSAHAIQYLDESDLVHCGITAKAHVKMILHAARGTSTEAPTAKRVAGMTLHCPLCHKGAVFLPGKTATTCECGAPLGVPPQPFKGTCTCGTVTTMPLGVSTLDCPACGASMGTFALNLSAPKHQTMTRDGGQQIIVVQNPDAARTNQLLECLVCMECCQFCCGGGGCCCCC